MAERAVARWLGGKLGDDARRRALLKLVGCVQPDGQFPCPPGARDTAGDSHPTVNEAMREVWERAGLAALPTSVLLAHPLGREEIIVAGRDAMTEQITGRDDVTVYWWALIERQSDWTELCIGALEQASDRKDIARRKATAQAGDRRGSDLFDRPRRSRARLCR